MTDLLTCGCPPMADADHAPDCDRNHWPHDACSDTVADPYDRAIAYAADRGTEDGKSAASWYFDGNTDRATYARVLQGIEDGDPEVLDDLPAPDLSGQWADTLTGPEIVQSAILAAGLGDDEETDSSLPDWFDAICSAYEDAFATAATDEIIRVATYQTAEDC